VGVHIAGAALHRRRNNIPPHAMTLSMYIVIRNPFINDGGEGDFTLRVVT
jgi:hypothetical protein